MSEPVVLGVERVNNPHVLPIFDELAKEPGIRFTGCVLQALPPWRIEIGWPELDPAAPYLQPFRRPTDRQLYHVLAREADVAIWPGLKFSGSPWVILRRNLRGRVNVIWSERFIERRERAWYETLSMRVVVRILNSSNMHLMAQGEGAEQDYRRFGATRWRAWRFGYAVRPVDLLPERGRPGAGGVLRLVFIGALRSKKGVDVLLRALGMPGLAGAAWALRIVGEGKERERLQALAGELGVATKVDFAGKVRHDAIADVYRQADVLVLPSRYEGWGAVVNEAMEYGVAVVASDGAGAARLLIEHGRSGFVFPSGDHESLGGYLRRLVDDSGLCAQISAAARERICLFRPRAVAQRVAALLRGLTGHGPMPDYAEGLCSELR